MTLVADKELQNSAIEKRLLHTFICIAVRLLVHVTVRLFLNRWD